MSDRLCKDMSSAARRRSKARYDAKRRGTLHRLQHERAGGAVRRAGLIKTGRCEYCGDMGRTVWNHLDYRCPLFVDGVCLRCHRRLHPRRVKGEGVA